MTFTSNSMTELLLKFPSCESMAAQLNSSCDEHASPLECPDALVGRTDRADGPRLISCREANPHEQEAYFREYPKI
jgi:hypothetical protein